eukprot:7126761-Lingulodinium_polyedra.AAC.1
MAEGSVSDSSDADTLASEGGFYRTVLRRGVLGVFRKELHGSGRGGFQRCGAFLRQDIRSS